VGEYIINPNVFQFLWRSKGMTTVRMEQTHWNLRNTICHWLKWKKSTKIVF